MTAVLARLLTKEDFGLIAGVSAAVGIVTTLRDFGLGQAAVQTPKLTHEACSTLFWLNAAFGLFVGSVVTAFGPVLAWMYDDPRCIPVAAGFGIASVMSMVGSQHRALLQRNLSYLRLQSATLIGNVAAIVVTIAYARVTNHYSSLIVHAITSGLLISVSCWIATGWIPGPPRRGTGVRPMLKFGGNLSGFNVVNYVSANFDNVMIRAIWGPAALGVYSQAYRLLVLPIRQINGPLTAVAVPALSRLVDEPESYRKFFRRGALLSMAVQFPVAAAAFRDAATP